MNENIFSSQYDPITENYESNTAVSREFNPNNIPLNMQIRLDVDKYCNDDIASVKIHNSLQCDMREYKTTIHHLENLKIYSRIRPETLAVIKSQIKTLTILEHRRNQKGGTPYNPAEWPLPF